MLCLVKTLLHFCGVRDLAWDPRKDILFLCQHYGEQLQMIRNQLDPKAVQRNFLGTPYFSRSSPDDQRRCYQILLGIEPPPVMAVTPAASFSTVVQRPHISGHDLSPTIKTQHTPCSPELLSPPLPGQSKTSRHHTAYTETRPLGPPASHDTRSRASEVAGATKDSRSRYRPISAQNGRKLSPTSSQITFPQTMHIRQFPQPPVLPSQQQPSYDMAASPVTAHGRRPLPTLAERAPTLGPPFARTPIVSDFATAAQQSQNLSSQVETSAALVPLNPGQQHMKSRAVQGNYHPLRQHPVAQMHIAKRLRHPEATTSQVYPPPREQNFSTLSSAVQPTKLRNVNINKRLHNESSPQSLSVEPVAYTSSTTAPPVPSQSSSRGMAIVEATAIAPIELDGMSELSRFIVELSAESTTGAEQHNELHSDQYTDTQGIMNPNVQGSPVSPPGFKFRSQQQVIPIRPLRPRTASAPLNALPASLIAGGHVTRKHYPQNNTSESHPASTLRPDLPNTNAARYSSYYGAITPPSSTPASPQPVSVSAYKAYQPPPPLPSLPLSPPAIPDSSLKSPRPRNFTHVTDVDEMNGYFKVHERAVSGDTCLGQDSRELALAYQAELPAFDEGYGSFGRVVA